jgi:hypothetical protein
MFFQMLCHKDTPQYFGYFEPYFNIHLLYEKKILHFELSKQVFYYFASETRNSETLHKKELTADDADLTLIYVFKLIVESH